MQKKIFGQTDLEVSPICFGTWEAGGFPFYRDQDELEAENLIRECVKLGINFFDTAPVYGFGKAEQILGRALRDCRDQVIISTKCGLRWKEQNFSGIYKNASKASILEEIDQSLKRLDTDYIDLYLIHWPDTDTKAPIGESLEVLETLKVRGKIRYYGLSNFSKSQIEEAQNYGQISGLQSRLSLLNDQVLKEDLPYCAKQGIGFQAYSPLERGVLTDVGLERLKERNEAAINWAIQKIDSEKLVEVQEQAQNFSGSMAQYALNWVLSQEGATTAIVGSTKYDHICEAVSLA